MRKTKLQPVDPPDLERMPLWAKVLIARARSWGFTSEDMLMVWQHCGGRCAVTGLPFTLETIGTGRAKKPFAPSLDKIDRSKGYLPENVRLVCALANFAMNAWGDVPFVAVCIALTRKLREKDAPWYRRQRAKIKAAERRAEKLTGAELRQARRQIAALRRALALGPGGLKLAALEARLKILKGEPAE